ncbi:MAG: LytTR family DNA-binding domain-containing protein [Schleiferiaceae bacterium]
MNLKCIIVEDEIIAQKNLENHCKKHESVELLEVFSNGLDAIEFLKSNEVDLIFLDIEMPELTGLEFLEKSPILPQVIFTTAKKEYAFEAYQHDVTHFLKKPISYSSFEVAITKALKNATPTKAAETTVTAPESINEVFIKVSGKFVRLSFDEILYIENVGDYVKIVTPGKSHVIHGTIKAMAAKLPENLFYRVHRSYIVNLTHIVDIEEGTLVIRDKVIPISRANRSGLMSKINLL